MGRAVFPYPGGKSQKSKDIVPHIPEHTLYCEVFGGAAGVLFNKPESRVEVYNDLDRDVVQFFEVLRDQSEELIEWLEAVPFSRAVFEEWREDFYHSEERPDDPVERAGRFFFLRYAQFSSRYNRAVSMSTSTAAGRGTNVPQKFSNKRDKLDEFAERFARVQIECQDFEDVIERYDNEDSFFYIDPPYVGKESEYYRVSDEFDHERLGDLLSSTEGKWIVSYQTIPDSLEDSVNTVVSDDQRYTLGSGGKGEESNGKELLLMNYDPDGVDLAYGD